MNEETDYEYDVALSFAGENRTQVEELAALLVEDGVRVFYDRYEQAILWGKDLYQHLQEVYRDRAQYCVIFVSSHYALKLWTKHELRQAQARAFREHQEYILPVRVDDTEIPGLNATVGYVDLRSHSTEDLRILIRKKVFGADVEEDDLAELAWRGEIITFRGEEAATFWPAKLQKAQDQTTYIANVPRIRFGDETGRWDTSKPCQDCFAVKGEYHVPGCDAEECPVCHGQALGCKCLAV